MANKKISDITAASSNAGTDLVEIETAAGSSKKTTLSLIKDYIQSTLSFTWGSITGTLADQTDLQSALDAKALATDLTTHTGDTANPHAVTAAQAGALAVGAQAADVDPAGTAIAAALDAKPNRWENKSSNFTAEAGKSYILDNSGITFTITLPSSPSLGDSFEVAPIAQAGIDTTGGSMINPISTGFMSVVSYVSAGAWNVKSFPSVLAVVVGGTGASDAAAARTNLGAEAAQTVVSQALAEAGTDTASTYKWTVQRVWQAIAAWWTAAKAATQTIGGAWTFTKAVRLTSSTPSQITSNQNDYALPDNARVRLSSDAARNITGFAAGATDQVVQLVNVGSFTISLIRESGSSTAANRITPSGTTGDYPLLANAVCTVMYDGTTSRWRVT